jgi:hypothetical protein
VIPKGSIIQATSVTYPASSITSKTSFERATIYAGAPNNNLQLHPGSINMQFNLMLTPVYQIPKP